MCVVYNTHLGRVLFYVQFLVEIQNRRSISKMMYILWKLKTLKVNLISLVSPTRVNGTMSMTCDSSRLFMACMRLFLKTSLNGIRTRWFVRWTLENNKENEMSENRNEQFIGIPRVIQFWEFLGIYFFLDLQGNWFDLLLCWNWEDEKSGRSNLLLLCHPQHYHTTS